VFITIYDAQGRAVDMIEKNSQSAGFYRVLWENAFKQNGTVHFSCRCV